MTNEKQELFATLGLIAEESVNEVKKEEPEVEKTCLESVEAEIAELDSIDKSNDEIEKASFESLVSDLDLLNQVLAYKSIKTAGTEEAALESISAEFGIANEGIKEIASKGVKAGKAVIAKIVKLIKSLFGVEETKKKVVKQLIFKAKAAELDKPAEVEVTDVDYQKYAELFIHSYITISQYYFNEDNIKYPEGINVPSDIKPLLDNYVNKLIKEKNDNALQLKQLEDSSFEERVKLIIDACKASSLFLTNPSSKPIDGLKELTVPEGFKMGPALIYVAQMLSRDPFDKQWRTLIKDMEHEMDSISNNLHRELGNAMIEIVKNIRIFKQNVIRSLTVMMGKYISRYKSAKTEKTA